MEFNEIHALVGDVPFISEKNARYLYDLIIDQKKENILELGIAHGTATCYMAAALHKMGRGSITAVDLIEVKDSFKPSAEEQIHKTGLSEYVSIHRMQTGYTWFLHDAIAKHTREDRCQEIYDLCIVDGPKNWTIDGAAFFFVDKLLKQESHIIFDDYNWTYSEASSRRDATDGITHRSLSQDEQDIPHIREVFELLVKQHPDYGMFSLIDDGDWAIAKKCRSTEKTYTVTYRTDEYLYRKDILGRLIKKIRKFVEG